MTLWIKRQAIDKQAMVFYNRAQAIAENYPCNLQLQPVIYKGPSEISGLPALINCICEEQITVATKRAKRAVAFGRKSPEERRAEIEAYGQQKLEELRQERERVGALRRKSGYLDLMQQSDALTDQVCMLDLHIAEMQASTLIGLCVQAVLWGFCCTDEDSMEDKIGHTMAVAAKRMLMQVRTAVTN